MIEQQIREFELVNSMLQAAMTADGANEQDQESVSQEAAATIAKLKSDLAKVREFERANGRLPTGTELEDVPPAIETPDLKSPTGEIEETTNAFVMELQSELAQSKAESEELKSELTALKTKLEVFSQSAEDESVRVQEAIVAIRAEHAAKIEELSSLQENKLSELLSASAAKVSEKDFELDKLRSELDELRASAAADADQTSQLAELQGKLDQAHAQLANKEKEMSQHLEEHSKLDSEVTRQGEVMQSLKDQLQAFQQTKKEESDKQTLLIDQLQEEINTSRQGKTDESAAAASALAAAEAAHSEKVQSIEKQLNDAQEELTRAADLHERYNEEENPSRWKTCAWE